MRGYATAAALVTALTFTLKFIQRVANKRKLHGRERVVVLGASSGIGKAIAQLYAARGAQVIVVGRRQQQLDAVAASCPGSIAIQSDFTSAEDIERLRDRVVADIGGLDTLIVSAGVSALRPLLDIANVERPFERDATAADIQRTADIANAAIKGNFTGPLVAAVGFIPLLTRSSTSPSILLISSVAALIPAPTRSLYCASKASSFFLYRALAIEHPEIRFTSVLPATVQGDFRASAVDGGPVRENAGANSGALTPEYVAKRCIQAVDRKERTVVLPAFYGWAAWVYELFPAFVEGGARKKYNFKV